MKKIISILLSLVLIFSLAVPAFASEGEAADYDGYPIVVVRGIDFGGLYYEDGTPAIGVSFEDILTFLKSYFSNRLIDKNEDALKDNALLLVEKIFSGISNDSEGNSINTLYYSRYDTSLAEYAEEISQGGDSGEGGLIKTAVKKVGYENVYYYTYDWRKSARELAAGLSDLVDTALEETGKDKVNIAAASMGGMVTTAYIYYNNGSEKINNLTYISSAHNGTYSCGDPLNGNIHFHGELFYAHCAEAMGDSIIMNTFLKLCKAVGIFDLAATLLNNYLKKNSDILYSPVLRDGFGTLLGLWALCPDDVFDSGVETLFGGYEDQYPVLMEKIADTRQFVFSTEETIDSAIADGVNITFTSNYGSPLSPVYDSANQQGDGVLETYLTSNFATTSKIGETLTEEQIAAADQKYLSPDKTVDATTALYRDVTWFIKDATHVATSTDSEFAEFVLWLILAEGQYNVLTDERYPQFMIDSDGKLLADE